ncbi:hypothetical protein HOL21_03465 [Candidatus Woesearchaeota archaeon]|nr:hypothetical protein [Candidatus Woesearchaeota archaeon]MBT5397245.1 hypothetical protein [Candidatus Woesearchaeota archaeon]MBT5924298.1 hypothetical protein [Candidatus Woesearchaeota archaeon]MBT6367209.1 hypothetical protein [Candidatus Woesearchaeota archaeon]MBT7762645.1 hypothetical protein [Candidatus Woesearchaeota archaeon]
MNIVTIILFFVYMWGFGYSVSHILKIKDTRDNFEKNIMHVGIGMCTFTVVGVILNTLHVPLYWWVFLILSIITVLYTVIKRRKNIISDFKLPSKINKKQIIYVILLLLFAFNLYTYASGSLAYSYMEDDDPWVYVREMKYVATEKTLDVDYFRQVNYLDPYPPAYSMMMGVLHQTSPDAQWTIKFFNALVIALGFLFFFFMVKVLTKSSYVALASTFILSMIPAYLSHFVWSHSLIPGLFFILIYCYEMISKDTKWTYITGIATGAILLTHPYQAIKLGIMAAIYFIVKWIYTKKFQKHIALSALYGIILSLFWWAFKYKDMIRMQARPGTAIEGAASGSASVLSQFGSAFMRTFSPDGGSATRVYTFADFFTAQKTNMINQPIGWGIVVSILLVIVLVFIFAKYKKVFKAKNYWLMVVLVWFLFTFLFVNSMTFNLPIGFGAFRMWMLLAIPFSILVGFGMLTVANLFKKQKVLWIVVLLLLVGGIFATSGHAKYFHNTNPGWPPGGRLIPSEVSGLVWMKDNLPLNSKVFMYGERANRFVLGVNMDACVWCEDEREFRQGIVEKDINIVYKFLKDHEYEYLAFTYGDIKSVKADSYRDDDSWTNEMVSGLITERINDAAALPFRFVLVQQFDGFILFRVA